MPEPHSTKTIQRMRELRPELVDSLTAVVEAAHQQSDAELVELWRTQIADTLRIPRQVKTDIPAEKREAVSDLYRSPLFSPIERAQLAFTEQFVISVDSVTDSQVRELVQLGSESDTYKFIVSLYAIEMTDRLTHVLGTILDTKEDD